MKIRPLPFLLAAIVALLPACQTVEQPKSTAHGYKSARLGRPTTKATSASRDDRANHAIQSALASTFRANGIAVDPNNADLTVGYLVVVQDNASTQLIDERIARAMALPHRSCASRRPRHSPGARAAVGDLRAEAIALLPR